MVQNKNNPNGNDEIIAVFFKKSLIFVGIVAVFVGAYYGLKFLMQKKEVVVEQQYQAPETLVKIEPPKVKFVEQAKERGIDFIHENGAKGERMLPETMGSGVAFIDFDNDGDQDVFFANGTNWQWDETPQNPSTQQFYVNDSKGFFTNETANVGLDHTFYGTGIAVGDINGDGFDDLFVAAVGDNRLYLNNGKKFELSEQKLDCIKGAWSTSSGFFDFDLDGDLDLMVLNYVKWSRDLDLSADYKIDGIGRAYGPPSNFPGTHNCLFKNENGQFIDVTEQSGMIVKNSASGQSAGKSLALVFEDLNADEWPDVVVANDTTKNYAFINQQNGTFKEQGEEYGLAYDSSGKATGAMGIDTSYYKNDKDFAVTVGNFANEMTSFYVNRENMGFFTDESVITGIGPQSRLALSFGLFFFDFDLDGRQDFFQTNGHVENDINKVQSAQFYAQKSQLFWNCGSACERTYVPIKSNAGINEIDLVGRGAAYGDIDNDGDYDVIVTQVAASAQVFINQTPHDNAHWVGLNLFKNSKPVTTAKITVHSKQGVQYFNYSSTKSYLSQVQKGQIIGIGTDKPSKIVVSYRGGEKVITDYNLDNWNTISLD